MSGINASEKVRFGETRSMSSQLPAPSQRLQPVSVESDSNARHAVASPSWFERVARGAVLRRLSGLRAGCMEIVEGSDRQLFGTPDANSTPNVPAMTVHRPRLFSRTMLDGTMGAAESYMDGDWSSNDLTALIRVFIQNLDSEANTNTGLARWTQPLHRLAHWLRSNSLSGSRKNIAAHYDLSNDFFALFLDETMMYSSAFFERADMELVEASTAKNERLCNILRLSPSDHLLEIGTGWGGFAIHAASRHGCRVTTTTISREQFTLAKDRIAKAGLAGRITVLLEDYRLLKGAYDKLVSIEMIEAVGHDYLDMFFKRCGELLKPTGALALQAITIQDRLFEQHTKSVDFIKKHIFPGSCLPSIARMLEATRKHTDFNLAHLDEITPHYVRTLSTWRERFMDKIDLIRGMGFGERFIRMWEFYLCYCEAGFAERHIGSVQMLLAKPKWTIQN